MDRNLLDNGRPLIDGRLHEQSDRADLTSYTKVSKHVPHTKPYAGVTSAPLKIDAAPDSKPFNQEYSPKYVDNR